MNATTAAALLALAVVLILSTRPAMADEQTLPGEAPDRDSVPASGLVWAGMGATLTPPEPDEPEPMVEKQVADRQKISTPERAVAPERPVKADQPGDENSDPAPDGKRVFEAQQPPENKTLSVTIPRLGLKDVSVTNSPAQSVLDRQGIMHLSGTGFPWQRLSNTYIAGHAQGYATSRVPRAFEDLDNLRDGDRIMVRDASGESYTYEVYKSLIVSPTDYWVTAPVDGRKVLTLQTCWPAPSYEKRLIIRAEIVKSAGSLGADTTR